jgi:hypothetical protein
LKAMRNVVAVIVLGAVLGGASARAADVSADKPGKWRPLFDGKTLNGWHHFGEGKWVVEDGAIVGKTDKASKLYSLLISDGVYHDFTVRFKFKSIQGNSGFYIRVVTEDPDKAHGLQIEVDPRKNPGGIYESYRRQWVDKWTPEEAAKHFKPDDWNEVVIAAYGGDVKVTVNGGTSAELKNDPSRPAGQIAMQMHSGNEMLVYFKDIEIKAVPREGEDKRGPTSPQKISPAKDGTIVLGAKHCKIAGPSLAYMPEWDALGFWREKDSAAWEVEVPKAGTYDVSMEWSVDDKNAGKAFVLESGAHKLEAKVDSTGRWDVYRIKKLGQIELDAGTQTLTLRGAGPFQHALMDLRELRLTPAKAGAAK